MKVSVLCSSTKPSRVVSKGTAVAFNIIQKIALGAALFIAAALYPCAARASGASLEARAESDRLVAEARRLIVDSLPEDRDHAAQLLVEAIRLTPDHVDAFSELARFTLWQVSMRFLKPYALSQSASLSRHVKELDPRRPLGTYLICEMMIALGQSKQALELFDRTRKEFPNHPDTFTFEARFFSETDPERSLASATKALAAGVPMDTLSPAISAALEESAQGNPEVLASKLRSFVTVYPDRWLWHRMAQSYKEGKQLDQAMHAYEKAIALGNQIESKLQLGIMLYEELSQPDRAVAMFDELLVSLKDKKRARPLALSLVHSHIAVAELTRANHQGAIKAAERAFKASPEEVPMIASLMQEFERRNALDLLETALSQLALANPTLDFAHVILSQIATRKENHKLAEKHLTNAIAMNPERDELYASRALAHYAMKNFRQALADFEKAIEVSPEQGAHHYNRACMLTLLGRAEEALLSLKEAVVLDSGFAELARTDSDLAEMRNKKQFAHELTLLGVLAPASAPSEQQKITAGNPDVQETMQQ